LARPPGEVVFKHWYPNQDYDSFIAIIRTFFQDAEGALGRRVTVRCAFSTLSLRR
jgi:hypothetical protein